MTAIPQAARAEAEAPTQVSATADVAPSDSDASAGVTPDELQALQDASETADMPPPPPQVISRAAPQSMNPDIALILDTTLASYTRLADAEWQGAGHDPRRPGFNLQALEMHIDTFVDPYLRFESALNFNTEGVEIEEAFATTLALPGSLQMRAGYFLTRFGRINTMHVHQWHFVQMPLVQQKFMGNEGNRGLGAEVSWLSPLPWYLEAVVSATSPYGGCTNISYMASTPNRGIHGITDALWTGAIKQFFPLGSDLSMLWGVSAQTAPNAAGKRTSLYGTDIYLRFRPLVSTQRQSISLQIEAMLRDKQVKGRRLQDVGGYVEVIWSATPRWELGGRSEWMSKVQEDFKQKNWPKPRTRQSVQLTFSPTHFSRLRLQTSIDRPQWIDRPVVGTFLALEVAVGAHGSHGY